MKAFRIAVTLHLAQNLKITMNENKVSKNLSTSDRLALRSHHLI